MAQDALFIATVATDSRSKGMPVKDNNLERGTTLDKHMDAVCQKWNFAQREPDSRYGSPG